MKVPSAPIRLSWPTRMAARVQAIFLPALRGDFDLQNMSGDDDTGEGGASAIAAYEATRGGRPSNVLVCV